MTEKLKSKKGFTLVELCVVIALMGVVVAMVIGFMGQFSKDTYSLLRNRTAMNDINAVRRITDEWLKYYDNGKYTVSPSDPVNGSRVLQAKNISTGKVDKLSIYDGEITWEKNGAICKGYAFDSITEAKFEFSEANINGQKPIIKCRTYFNNGKNWQDLLFSVMTETPRSRYSPAET